MIWKPKWNQSWNWNWSSHQKQCFDFDWEYWSSREKNLDSFLGRRNCLEEIQWRQMSNADGKLQRSFREIVILKSVIYLPNNPDHFGIDSCNLVEYWQVHLNHAPGLYWAWNSQQRTDSHQHLEQVIRNHLNPWLKVSKAQPENMLFWGGKSSLLLKYLGMKTKHVGLEALRFQSLLRRNHRSNHTFLRWI